MPTKSNRLARDTHIKQVHCSNQIYTIPISMCAYGTANICSSEKNNCIAFDADPEIESKSNSNAQNEHVYKQHTSRLDAVVPGIDKGGLEELTCCCCCCCDETFNGIEGWFCCSYLFEFVCCVSCMKKKQ